MNQINIDLDRWCKNQVKIEGNHTTSSFGSHRWDNRNACRFGDFPYRLSEHPYVQKNRHAQKDTAHVWDNPSRRIYSHLFSRQRQRLASKGANETRTSSLSTSNKVNLCLMTIMKKYATKKIVLRVTKFFSLSQENSFVS